MKTRKTITMDSVLAAQLDSICERHGDVTWHVENAIRDYIKNLGKPSLPVVVKEKAVSARFKAPCLSEAQDEFILKGGCTDDALAFCNFYESKGWMVGKNKMKSWRAAVAGWLKRKEDAKTNPTGYKTAREKSAERNADIFDYEKATTF